MSSTATPRACPAARGTGRPITGLASGLQLPLCGTTFFALHMQNLRDKLLKAGLVSADQAAEAAQAPEAPSAGPRA